MREEVQKKKKKNKVFLSFSQLSVKEMDWFCRYLKMNMSILFYRLSEAETRDCQKLFARADKKTVRTRMSLGRDETATEAKLLIRIRGKLLSKKATS